MPSIEEPEAEQQMAKAGDVFLVHYQVKHGTVTNTSPLPRYAIYFRLNHVDHDQQKFEALTDVWLEWEGVRPLGRPH
jgi:ectoine hydroxylase-related dioxygenase (phytanoyl-CoA dioxygenase family)